MRFPGVCGSPLGDSRGVVSVEPSTINLQRTRQRPDQRARQRPNGFTLLELIVSLTIISLVVLVIYGAFALGVRVWERQGQEDETLRREEIMLRLLAWDAAEMAPYNAIWQGEPLFFFAGGTRTLFYVTRNGFGALRRQGRALFFTCLYVAEAEDGTLGLHLYKAPEPQPDLLRELRAFSAMTPAMRERYAPPQFIQDEAIRIADGFSTLELSFSADRFIPFAGPDQERLEERMLLASEDALDQEDWSEDSLPGQIQLRYGRKQGEEARVLLTVDQGAAAPVDG